jgi:hypothetical protein
VERGFTLGIDALGLPWGSGGIPSLYVEAWNLEDMAYTFRAETNVPPS